ncbi:MULTISPECIES: hypothetical protein [Clostridium]|uniref:Uncharacterized protein n=1 Tax=Clostridium cibarium TaxID=2762247 RepID=A0ABR8PZ22_9CLOT|nr:MULTISPECIES: hypothetical protein [Clostridium]MBD7913414.1 hypothetical protein [Clostridium cibarium]
MNSSNTRKLQTLIYISIAMILLYPANTLSYLVIKIKISDFTNLNHLSLFFLVVDLIGLISFRNVEITAETKEKTNLRTRPLYLFSILIIGYVLFDNNLKTASNTSAFMAFIIMEAYLIFIILFTKNKLSFILQDRKLQWIKATQNIAVDKWSNFTWRLKIWITTHEKVDFRDRLPNPIRVLAIGLIVTDLLANYSSVTLFIGILFFILFFNSFLMCIECLFGLQTSLIGICTGYEYVPNSDRDYYNVYITDYENKREIHFRSYEELDLIYGEEVRVVHGIFSKLAISVNGIVLERKS